MGLQILALPSGLVPAAHDAAVTYQRNWDKHRKLPMIMFVITGGDRPIMVDTGTPDAAFVREYFGYTFERPAEEDTLLQLTGAGIDPADVRDVVFTHLHWDHCSNVELFPNARFTVQDDELRYAVSPIPLHRRAYQHLPRHAAALAAGPRPAQPGQRRGRDRPGGQHRPAARAHPRLPGNPRRDRQRPLPHRRRLRGQLR